MRTSKRELEFQLTTFKSERIAFRDSVMERSNHKCSFCDLDAVDAHHIMERRLFFDGGYHLENGIAVCAKHHLDCEMTLISVEECVEAIGINKRDTPLHLYRDQKYDKWGNPILANGTRLRGELFDDESVQKILKQGNVLDLFLPYVKYPRTYHLPWSKGITSDDRVIEDTWCFDDEIVVVTEKMDGENTTMYSDYFHARSLDSAGHPSQTWAKNFWSSIKHDIPLGWRVCGENLYATHSIKYDDLPSYFIGFSIWTEKNECLPWNETLEWFQLLGIIPVKVLYYGSWNESQIKSIAESMDLGLHEGLVVRREGGFSLQNFSENVAKFVRPNHVRTEQHGWKHKNNFEVNKVKL